MLNSFYIKAIHLSWLALFKVFENISQYYTAYQGSRLAELSTHWKKYLEHFFWLYIQSSNSAEVNITFPPFRVDKIK